MKIGDKVIVMYHFDPQWWKVEGTIVSTDEDDYMVLKENGQQILIQAEFLKLV